LQKAPEKPLSKPARGLARITAIGGARQEKPGGRQNAAAIEALGRQGEKNWAIVIHRQISAVALMLLPSTRAFRTAARFSVVSFRISFSPYA
jgi:hypothetical protein